MHKITDRDKILECTCFMVYHIFMRRFIFGVFVSLCLCGCFTGSPKEEEQATSENKTNSTNIIDCPENIANRAFYFAELYEKEDTVYEWGEQDPLRAVKLDCSGLVIMCYTYALVGTKYSLLLPDMASSYICEKASTHVQLENMRQGDLLFMGEEGDSKIVSHIALFDCVENGNIYFIDCTDSINKVSRRFYPKDDSRFKYFGMMQLKTK